ncbi:MAG TPA: tRNA (guanine(37)-N(1))-methyltransferase, partial [Clostridia bacterium]|nr:tRNA (guanine(37)-N(1))-methyltransferase [Clostridia bacterium]
GVLADESLHEESLTDNLLEYPHYTRPVEYHGMKVPDVLLSGNHAEIEKWRRRQRLLITARRRLDLLEKAKLSEEDILFLRQNGINIR